LHKPEFFFRREITSDLGHINGRAESCFALTPLSIRFEHHVLHSAIWAHSRTSLPAYPPTYHLLLSGHSAAEEQLTNRTSNETI